MRRELGKIFKVIRESKGFSQKEVADGIISPAQLSRFERGVSSLNVESFYDCLKHMNVPLDEFQFIYHEYTQTQDVLFSEELSKAYLARNTLKIQQILEECQRLMTLYPKHRYYKFNTTVVKAVLYYCDNQIKVSNKEVQDLTDYLFTVEEWGRYELWIFTNSVGLMTMTTLETFTKEMLHRTQFYRTIPDNRKRILRMLLNVIGMCIEQGYLHVAFKFLRQTEQFTQQENDLYERILTMYYKGFYNYKMGNEEGISEMIRCSEIMSYLECYSTAKQMKDQIAVIKN